MLSLSSDRNMPFEVKNPDRDHFQHYAWPRCAMALLTILCNNANLWVVCNWGKGLMAIPYYLHVHFQQRLWKSTPSALWSSMHSSKNLSRSLGPGSRAVPRSEISGYTAPCLEEANQSELGPVVCQERWSLAFPASDGTFLRALRGP